MQLQIYTQSFFSDMYTGVIFLSADDKMVCLDPHYCQSAVDMSKDDFPTQVKKI